MAGLPLPVLAAGAAAAAAAPAVANLTRECLEARTSRVNRGGSGESSRIVPERDLSDPYKTIKDTARGVPTSPAMLSSNVPNSFVPPQQAVRDSPVRMRYGGGGDVRIQIPFPFSLPIVAGHLLYSIFSSPESESESSSIPAAPSAATVASAPTAMPPDDEGDNDSDTGATKLERRPNRCQKPEISKISRNQMEKLLETDGEDIYKNLKNKAAADFGPGAPRTIWKNKDFRVDVGHLDSKRGIRHWDLQVNKNPDSSAAKRLLRDSKSGTHEKQFKDTFDVNNPPGLEEWRRAVLDASRYR